MKLSFILDNVNGHWPNLLYFYDYLQNDFVFIIERMKLQISILSQKF